MTSTLTVPEILTPPFRADAVSLLRSYFGPISGATGWTGSRFERFAGGGDGSDVADRFTAADLVAVTLLSVDVPARGAIDLLETRADEFSALLTEIPTDLELVDVVSIPESWAPTRLWTALRDIRGIGWVTAGKLVARKRPFLIPVYDTVVQGAVRPTGSFWEALRVALRAHDRALHRYLVELRDEAEIGTDISPLRVFDVVVWMAFRP
ncbi:DUF6308 family protein [Cellulosimicrobium sp. NPDC057862]|uniref:DUF6308 family protein n=1 Tax=Cellulosimicrobium sp. NPDC057862 TaxID=3346266 RepID=UPI00367059E7